jgi:predicted esterase
MMYNVLVREPKDGYLSAAVLLPGRGQPASSIMALYDRFAQMDDIKLLAVEPIDEWYPAPKGANDQMEAVWGLKVSVEEFNDFISSLEIELELDRSKIALVGFSAGAVLAIQAAAYSDRPFGAVVAHAGAILEPLELPQAKHETPFLIMHNQDDDCFSWDERYLPMKLALVDKKYQAEFIENEIGGHSVTSEDLETAGKWLNHIFRDRLLED